ncbi:barstar family protein [Dactylosporangium salmoneum]|uniref:Barstar (barnase inhibitor) domain-containing protein n=1 Tax=Dactylosporangium salmoneum TaxID=53361 RepID=A0ABN3H320_9ACTN
MAAFDPDSNLNGDVAYRLLANTAVTLFWRRRLLAETTVWLTEHGYQVITLDAADWSTEGDMHRAVAAALGFPDYYGHNLDALNDCMRDVVGQQYGWTPATTGLAVVFTAYDTFATRCPRAAQIVLDILAEHSRSAALIGRRLMCLVQSNDPNITFEPVGATPVNWNDAEWLNANRRAV